MRCQSLAEEFEAYPVLACPVLELAGRRRARLPRAVRARLEAEVLGQYDTAGQKLAAAEVAYVATRRDWPTLPGPVLDELAGDGLLAMASDDWDGSLSAYVQMRLEAVVSDDLALEYRGRNKRLSVRAVTSFGRRWLTRAYETGIRLSESIETALSGLVAVIPEPTEAELAEAVAMLEREAA
jgi:hypothetical protein